MMNIQELQSASILDFEKKLLYYSGFYPLKNSKFNFIYKIVGLLTIISSVGFFVVLVVRLYLDIGNFSIVVEVLHILLSQTAFLCKFFLFLHQLPKLYKMEEILRGDVFNNQHRSQDVFIINGINHYKLFSRVFRSMCIIVSLFYAIYAIVDNQLLLVPAWFPVDVDKYRLYLIAYEFMCFNINSYDNSCVDCITAALISMASAQLEILKDNLTHINNIKTTKLDVQEIIKKRLRKCVIHHNTIIDFVERIEDMFSGGIFFQFMSTIVILCLTGIQFTVISPTSFKFFALFLYFIAIMNQVVISCWFGHDIMENSSNVGQACYMSNWYECSQKNQKTIFIIMERSKRPVVLTAGKFFTLSLTTFIMILRSAYSYFAVLRRVYQKKN